MTQLLKTIQESIDCPLMDVNNISKIILGYAENYLYKFELVHHGFGSELYYNSIILASSPLECWKLWKKRVLKMKVFPWYKKTMIKRLNKKEFLDNLQLYYTKRYYTERKIQYVYVYSEDEGFKVLEYKKPTKNVIRENIINDDNPYGEGRMLRHRITGEYNYRIRDKDGIDEHDFSMFPFYGVEFDGMYSEFYE